MKLIVSCQVCGRIIQQIDNGFGDEVPFTPEDVAMYSGTATCEIDGTANIATIFTREVSADVISAKLAKAVSDLADAQVLVLNLEAQNSQLEYEISQLPDAASLYDQLTEAQAQLQQDQIQFSDLQQQVQDQTNKAQILAGAMNQEKSLGERGGLLSDMIEYQVTSPSPNIPQVKALMDELQTLVQQITVVADDSLGLPLPAPLGVWVHFPPERYDDFQTYLTEQDPVVDPISALDGFNLVQMTQPQYAAWLQFLAI